MTETPAAEAGSAEADDPVTAAASRSKPRWWLRAAVAVVALAVLAGGAELALRAIIPSVIANVVRENLQLDEAHPVRVELGGSALLPALTGRVGEVSVTVPHVQVLDGIEATLHAHADSLPFDPTKGEIRGATASAKIPASSMGAIVALATDGLVDEGDVRPGELIVGRTLPIFGFEVHLTVGLAVSVQQGDLLIEPTSLSAVGFDLTADELRPLLGDAAAKLLDAHTVCVRDRLPAAITLTEVALSYTGGGGAATVSIDIAPDALSNPAMQEPGSC